MTPLITLHREAQGGPKLPLAKLGFIETCSACRIMEMEQTLWDALRMRAKFAYSFDFKPIAKEVCSSTACRHSICLHGNSSALHSSNPGNRFWLCGWNQTLRLYC